MVKSTFRAFCITLALGGALWTSGLAAAESPSETQATQVSTPQPEQVSINQATAEQLAAAMNGIGLKKRRRLSAIVSSTGPSAPSSS